MFYFCYFICFIARTCFGSAPQCDGSATEVKGKLGQPFSFENVVLELNSKSLTLQRTIKNQRITLLTYSRTSQESKLPTYKRYRYNEDKSSIENLKLQREDQGIYEIIKVFNESTQIFCKYDLKVYEEITNVMINVTHSHQNGSCIVTMDCVLQTGDQVTFRWTEDQKDLHYNSTSLKVLVPKDNATGNYSCRAQNPVSRASREVNLMEICYKTPDSGMNVHLFIYLISGALAGLIIAIVGIVIRKRLSQKIGKLRIQPRSPPQMPPPPNPAAETQSVNTVYAEVQKKEISIKRRNEGPSQPVTLETFTVYSYVERKKSEDNYTTVYELAGPIALDP